MNKLKAENAEKEQIQKTKDDLSLKIRDLFKGERPSPAQILNAVSDQLKINQSQPFLVL